MFVKKMSAQNKQYSGGQNWKKTPDIRPTFFASAKPDGFVFGDPRTGTAFVCVCLLGAIFCLIFFFWLCFHIYIIVSKAIIHISYSTSSTQIRTVVAVNMKL